MIELQPYDVVVVDGLGYMPHHWLIQWRGLDRGVHCCFVSNMMTDEQFALISPEFSGIRKRAMSHYRGRRVTIHRYNGTRPHRIVAREWLRRTLSEANGYDFRQWVMGFVFGMTTRSQVDNSKLWTCAELPYWFYQDLCGITPVAEVLPMPRLFRYNPLFTTVFDGIWE